MQTLDDYNELDQWSLDRHNESRPDYFELLK